MSAQTIHFFDSLYLNNHHRDTVDTFTPDCHNTGLSGEPTAGSPARPKVQSSTRAVSWSRIAKQRQREKSAAGGARGRECVGAACSVAIVRSGERAV